MTPTIDERLASVVRALTDVILPSLPPEAGLAKEQLQLSVGHLQILRAQLDAAPAFERQELDDVLVLATDLVAQCSGGERVRRGLVSLQSAMDSAATAADVRIARMEINRAIAELVQVVADDGDPVGKKAISAVILKHEQPRASHDRQWCAPFGFDSL